MSKDSARSTGHVGHFFQKKKKYCVALKNNGPLVFFTAADFDIKYFFNEDASGVLVNT